MDMVIAVVADLCEMEERANTYTAEWEAREEWAALSYAVDSTDAREKWRDARAAVQKLRGKS